MNGYDEDLAYVHDVGFGSFATNAAPWLIDALRNSGINNGVVAELGCGSGILAAQLASAGYSVWGVDISPAMIAMSQACVPTGDFHVGSLIKTDIPNCEAVVSIGECLNYQFDENAGASQLRPLFQRIYSALRPGGLYVFDVAEPGRGTGLSANKHFRGEDWSLLLDVEEDSEARHLVRRIEVFRRVGDGELYRRSTAVHHLALYPRDDVEAKLRDVGFDVKDVPAYGDQVFPHGIAAFLATKPGA